MFPKPFRAKEAILTKIECSLCGFNIHYTITDRKSPLKGEKHTSLVMIDPKCNKLFLETFSVGDTICDLIVLDGFVGMMNKPDMKKPVFNPCGCIFVDPKR